MSSNAVPLGELKRLQEQWLRLRDEFPRVYHCCAEQTGPALIEGSWLRPGEQEWTESAVMGVITSNILGRGLPGEPYVEFKSTLPAVELPDHVLTLLNSSIWGDLFLSIIDAGIAPMKVVLRGDSQRMAIMNESPEWFGRFDFAEEPRRALSCHDGQIPEEFQIAARDSIALSDCNLSHASFRVSAINRWLSDVYSVIGIPELSSDEHTIRIADLRQGQVLSVGQDKQTIPAGGVLSLQATVPLRGVSLGSDICTASMKAIALIMHRLNAETRSKQSLKRPSDAAFKSFALRSTGSTANDTAEQVYGDKKKQYQISRDVKRVEAYLSGCGFPKEMWATEASPPNRVTMDPAKIDLGQRKDGRTPRQREKSENLK